MGDIPRSNFQFDFEVERKIFAEAEKDIPNWSRLGLENLPSRAMGSASPSPSVGSFSTEVFQVSFYTILVCGMSIL